MIIESEEALLKSGKLLENEQVIVCDLETDGLDTRVCKLTGIGYGTKGNAFFLPFPNDIKKQKIVEFLTKLFEKKVVFHNAKYDLKLLLYNNFPIPKQIHDTMIMSWLIDENSQHGLKALAKEILGKNPKKWIELNHNPDLFMSQEDILWELAEYCCEDVKNTYLLYEYFYPMLGKEGVLIDYERIEMKMIFVLVHMEMRGIKLDVSWLQEKQLEAKRELYILDRKIFQKIGEKFSLDYFKNFSIRSNLQIERLLFDFLRYPTIKETVGGKRSTDNEVLGKIVKKRNLKEDDIVSLILKYRELDKIYGTYLTPLVEYAGTENVIHTNFLQHGTVTGRFASNEPNCQAIPSRTDNWNVRYAFMAREGYSLLQADYGQIELRILAHLSGDENMIEVFKNGGDIHTKTMELLKIKERRISKNVNFGIVYGVGPRTLAEMLGVKEEEARSYIQGFLDGYPQVKSYIRRIQNKALQDGFITMISGRKRRFHEYRDSRWLSAIARQAVNTSIQGSSSDLIKIAMIRLESLLQKLDAHLLLQIHDEVIVECKKENIEEVKKIIKETMENALKLRVPLVVNITENERWVKS